MALSHERPQSLTAATSGYLGEMFEMKGKAAAVKLATKFGGMIAFVYAPRIAGLPHSTENFKEFWEFALFGKNPASYLMGTISEHINETPFYGEPFPDFVKDYAGVELPHVYGLGVDAIGLAALGASLYAVGVALLAVERHLDNKRNI